MNKKLQNVTNTKSANNKKETKSSVKTTKNTEKKVLKPTDKDGVFEDADGNKYSVNSKSHTMKKISSNLKNINVEELNLDSMPMTIYQRYLKDRYMDEPCTLKKDKLHFRDFVVSCSTDEGFVIKDTHKKYAVVSDFTDIPTPKELGDWFERPTREFTAEENRKAEEAGRKALEERLNKQEEEEEAEVDFEKLRKKLIGRVHMIQEGRRKCEDPIEEFKDFIPFKPWRRKCNALLKRWTNREIRFKKFLRLLEEMTEDISFEVAEKNHRMTFQGTLLPAYHKVGNLVGNMLEVDNKKIYAVPFLVEFMLHYEPKMMPQYMKFARKEISAIDFIKEPVVEDWKEEYKKNMLENSAENAKVLSCAMTAAGIMPPQLQLFSDDLKVGDRIYYHDIVNDEWVYRDILKVEGGVEINNEVGLMKCDDFIVVGHRDILKIPYNFSGVDNNKETEETNKESIVTLNNWYKRLVAFYPFNNVELNGKMMTGIRLYFGKGEGNIFTIYGDYKKMTNRIRKFLMQQGITKFEENEQRCLGDKYEQPK